MSHRNRITWRADGRYSPVQDRSGVREPTPADFPPATRRVSQRVDSYANTHLDEREVLRVTYQGDDRCQLACPGCYTGARLRQPAAEVQAEGGRKAVSWPDFTGHVAGLGTGLQDFFLLGAEATVDPAGSAAKLAHARDRGLPLQIITHGAVSVDRFEATFGQALDSGAVHKLIISLDSMSPRVNNTLRGRGYAHQRTLEIINHCVNRRAPFKVQMTVWPLNYPTILESMNQLFDLGVRGFSFHSGSLEGIDNPDAHGLDWVDPLAWRALVEQILRFRDEHLNELWTFNVPFLFVTGEELERYVIGDRELTAAYLSHADAVEQGRRSPKPVHVCPALDIPPGVRLRQRRAGPAGHGVALQHPYRPGGRLLRRLRPADPTMAGTRQSGPQPAPSHDRLAVSVPRHPVRAEGIVRPVHHRGRAALPRVPLHRLWADARRPRPARRPDLRRCVQLLPPVRPGHGELPAAQPDRRMAHQHSTAADRRDCPTCAPHRGDPRRPRPPSHRGRSLDPGRHLTIWSGQGAPGMAQ